jgi:alpha-ketoglutarate-dependent taurine dioxygenase
VPSARPLSFRSYSVASNNSNNGASLGPKPSAEPNEATVGTEIDTPAVAPVQIAAKHTIVPFRKGNVPYLHTLLRDGCKCPQCVDQHSKQRSFRLSDIPANIKPRSAKFDGTKLEIQWKNDIPGFDPNHTSVYHQRTLRQPSANFQYFTSGHRRKRTLWGKPLMSQKQHWISYNDYVNDEAKFAAAMRDLASTGLLFVKDIPDSREMVEKIATRMGPLRNTFYGATWDVRTVPQAKNVAYTSQYLGFHMDLMYMNEPPGFQLLHCLQNSCDGGQSLFADAFFVAEKLQREDPDAFETLSNFQVAYEYNHSEHVYSNEWPIFERYRDRKSKQWRLLHANYSPPFQAPIYGRMRSAKYTETGVKALKKFADMLEDESNIFELKLNPGECVIFENRRVLHARRQFNMATGQRWLAGAYVDEDALLSTFAVMSRKHRDVWQQTGRRDNGDEQGEE